MTAARHTAGPWSYESDGDVGARTHYIVSAEGERIADVLDVGMYSNRMSAIERNANARLLAAAPRLLEIARRYASECGQCFGQGVEPYGPRTGQPCEQCAHIRAVLAIVTT